MSRITAHPGEVLKEEYLIPLGLTQGGLAVKLQVSSGQISRLIAGKGSLSPEMALRLSRVFGTTTMFWLGLQVNHDLSKAKADKELMKKIDKLKPMFKHAMTEGTDDDQFNQ